MESTLRSLPTDSPAQRQINTIEAIQDERTSMAVAAARHRPPPYITAELGERPVDGREAFAWDRAVSAVERYRRETGVTDPDRALGAESAREDVAREAKRRVAGQELREARRQLGKETGRDLSRGIERSIGR